MILYWLIFFFLSALHLILFRFDSVGFGLEAFSR